MDEDKAKATAEAIRRKSEELTSAVNDAELLGLVVGIDVQQTDVSQLRDQYRRVCTRVVPRVAFPPREI